MVYGDTQTMNGTMAVYQQNRPIETVSLSRLIDFSIQRTYHELVVLTELLPRKSDMERKIEIVTFANRTRQLFVRLLALVKWAGSASKVEKCSTIVSFLDKQSMLFTETADILAKMSRESLVQARLPSFQLPSAVEVLTSGTYTRLPACIRDKIVPPDPITGEEKKVTLLRLNHIIQQRLVSSQLPKQMRNLRIEFGRVVFHVPFEFELTLTLMGDSVTLPWRVLDLAILVEDKDTGEGKDLVHHLQNSFLQHIVQAKLTENHRSLTEAYEILHSFCLSLQLEVLHAQTIRLSRERLGDFVRVEEYVPGARLTISYWREQQYNDGKGCRLTIEMNAANPGEPLTAAHHPDLGDKETQFANRAIRSDTLSIEKLLIYSTHERAKEILRDLQEQLQKSKEGSTIDYELNGSPPALSISYLRPCMNSEKLILSVDALTGQLLIHVPQFEQCPLIDELQMCAKKDTNRLMDLIRRLRIWVCKERHKKTAEFVGVQVTDCLPIVNSDLHPQLQTTETTGKLFVMFSKHPQHCLLIKFDSSEFQNQKYFMILLESSGEGDAPPSANDTYTSSKALYSLNSIFELNIDCILQQKHGKKMADSYLDTSTGLKRKRTATDDQVDKRACLGSFYISEFAYIINFCEEKLAYGCLCKELQVRSLCHVVRSSSEYGCSHYVDLIRLPVESAATRLLHKQLLSCNIRLQSKNKLWLITFRFAVDESFADLNQKDQIKTSVFLVYDCSHSGSAQLQQMLDELHDEWHSIAKLYDCFTHFWSQAKQNSSPINVDVRSYTFKKLILAYGPNKQFTVSLTWKTNENRFILNFGVCGTSAGNSNPHVLVATQLQHEFNQTASIANLVHLLNSTFQPIATIHYLNSIPLLGIINSVRFIIQFYLNFKRFILINFFIFDCSVLKCLFKLSV
jgi:mediator of RNA polymerase II transcription subunit 14